MELSLPKVLVVDARSRATSDLLLFLKDCGYEVLWAADGETAYNILDNEIIDVLIAELHVHRINGMRLLQVARKRNPEVCVVMITADADVELATEAMREGAYDFQTKPLNLSKLKVVIERAVSHQKLVLEMHDLYQRIDERYGLSGIIGSTPKMVQVYNKIREIAPTRTTVLLIGKTGTGKALAASAIHANSPRRDCPFVKLNCAALAESVIESELFGHERGAFTGAHRTRKGRFEIADGGTLFIDEVSEISPSTQVKLLRFLEERQLERLGGNDTIEVDVRLIAATNRDLKELVDEGKFREDLYYRLAVVLIEIPDLRERKQDIPLLVQAFLDEFNKAHNKSVKGVSRGVMDAFMTYDWPGNVRELRNCIEGMIAFARPNSVLGVSDLPPHLREQKPSTDGFYVHVGMTMQDVEKAIIEETLQSTGHNKEKTAEMLQIGLRTLYRKIKEYQIE
ncbi:MAG: sigma-54-dependent Fis family transcriptional regulator [Candidatus Abyssobacteria bacterium SURF_17]|uniref:Sigma-54-dependent Fis family transcriptional regulator n=1 Tax=Candidatus Abyssobacteria bacterium SURF_17 TaxID=2093361 RepID=A0A419EU32_9BACT|nr:MAG: sigma-54-dependent Fis family transcriptional regulator [Candidatus Abyssubacteria bacterium SURF_17]